MSNLKPDGFRSGAGANYWQLAKKATLFDFISNTAAEKILYGGGMKPSQIKKLDMPEAKLSSAGVCTGIWPIFQNEYLNSVALSQDYIELSEAGKVIDRFSAYRFHFDFEKDTVLSGDSPYNPAADPSRLCYFTSFTINTYIENDFPHSRQIGLSVIDLRPKALNAVVKRVYPKGEFENTAPSRGHLWHFDASRMARKK
ncbi:hypothetical protein L0B53_18945 (plasmid) [Vibrio sp. SS-MA-C1-2]|uniref:hypothetical protein n=1 Tax=Vibrio sp. SS-MA-C1-2 TaxID=2908646 RepID=UPI001F22D724|nr:hypothetical protein [Vibrio sp. SS-MA-C1-2]UJF20214.1 hypothetical protein L0B53_18945 [Vibrio sp. SS-MA-C1-2]